METEETPDKGASEEGCPPLKTPKKKKKKGETTVKKKMMKIEMEDSQDMEVSGSGVITVQGSLQFRCRGEKLVVFLDKLITVGSRIRTGIKTGVRMLFIKITCLFKRERL